MQDNGSIEKPSGNKKGYQIEFSSEDVYNAELLAISQWQASVLASPFLVLHLLD